MISNLKMNFFLGPGFPPGFHEAARRAFAGFHGSPNGEHIAVGPDPPGYVYNKSFKTCLNGLNSLS